MRRGKVIGLMGVKVNVMCIVSLSIIHRELISTCVKKATCLRWMGWVGRGGGEVLGEGGVFNKKNQLRKNTRAGR